MSKFKTYPFKDKDVSSIAEALVELPHMMNAFRRFMNGMRISPDVDRIIIPPDCAETLFPSDAAGGGSSSMFYPSTSTANEISVTAGVCVVGLTSYDISALSDEAVSDGEWLILKVDMRDPAVTPVYEVVSNPYPIVTETYFKYIKIARFNGDGDFQRAHNGGLLEVDFT